MAHENSAVAQGDPGSAEVWLRLRSHFPSSCWSPPACSFALSRSSKRSIPVSLPKTFCCSHWTAECEAVHPIRPSTCLNNFSNVSATYVELFQSRFRAMATSAKLQEQGQT